MTDPPQPNLVSRREFLGRAAKAGLSAVAAGAVGFWLHDRHGPGPATDDADQVVLPDYRVATDRPRLAIVHGQDRQQTITRALTAVGGLGAYVRSGDRVLLKVNAAFATPASLGATTHPDLVTEMVRLCRRAGAAEVIVADNPINDPASCFELSGIGPAARAAGARVVLPQPSAFRPTTLTAGKLIRNWPLFHEPFRGVTKLIGIAPVKDHHRSGASLTMKNWYGLLGGRRNVFHQDIHTIITELALLIRPSLVILDGTATMMTNGPTGGSFDDLRPTNTMIVSTDQVAADACGATLLGRSVADLPFISRAAAAGAGTADYRSLQPVEVDA